MKNSAPVGPNPWRLAPLSQRSPGQTPSENTRTGDIAGELGCPNLPAWRHRLLLPSDPQARHRNVHLCRGHVKRSLVRDPTTGTASRTSRCPHHRRRRRRLLSRQRAAVAAPTSDRRPSLVVRANLPLPERAAAVRHGADAGRQRALGGGVVVDECQEVRAVPARLGAGGVRAEVHDRQDGGAVAQGVSP